MFQVAWHPTAEGIIAYGTDEGRIGIADVQRKKYFLQFLFLTHFLSLWVSVFVGLNIQVRERFWISCKS